MSEVVSAQIGDMTEEGDVLFWKLMMKSKSIPNYQQRHQSPSELGFPRLQSNEVANGLPGGAPNDEILSDSGEEVHGFTDVECIMEKLDGIYTFDSQAEGIEEPFPVNEIEIHPPGARGDQIRELSYSVAELTQSVIIKGNSLQIEHLTLNNTK